MPKKDAKRRKTGPAPYNTNVGNGNRTNLMNQAAHNSAVAAMGGLPGYGENEGWGGAGFGNMFAAEEAAGGGGGGGGGYNPAVRGFSMFANRGGSAADHSVARLVGQPVKNVQQANAAVAPEVAAPMAAAAAAANKRVGAAAQRHPPMTQTRVDAGLRLMEMLANGNHIPELNNLATFTEEELYHTSPSQIKQYKDKARELLSTKRSEAIKQALQRFINM